MALGFVQLYSSYDHVIANLVHLLRYPAVEGSPVLHVFATPERAFAQVERKVKRNAPGAQGVFPLPFLSIDRIDDVYDPSRTRKANIGRMFYTADMSRYYSMDWPIPMNLTYQINLWCKKIPDLNSLTVQFLQLFPNTQLRYETVQHPFPLNDRIVPIKIIKITDAPRVPEAEKQRVIRRVITIQVDGWVSRAALETGIVEKVTVDYFDSDDMETEGDLLGHTETTADKIIIR